ncbi:MAG TPA: hypothetical protein GXZ21_06880 [Clostridiales bacterium]|nr:hypothetical protein [Clostridiales bacterium]
MTNYNKYLLFREKYPDFIFEDYNFSINKSTIDIEFHFIISGLAEFKPSWSISKNDLINIEKNEIIDTLVFSLGMVELISYWKITCSPNVHIKCGMLSQAQAMWWKKLYRKGLGEFFYLNNISVDDDFMKIIHQSSLVDSDSKLVEHKGTGGSKPSVLIPIGGGKDSVTTLEILRDDTKRFCYIINPRQATIDSVNVGKIPRDNVIVAKRTLDHNMLRLNKEGFLNGHTPFSALVAFSSVIAAYINNIEYVALSNEASANESTVSDTDVNHQYSKSYEFELDFINYEAKYINSQVKYFSLLRPLTELKIAQLFSKLTSYHDIFRSCNSGSKSDSWCGMCPKCLFVYIILSPFISRTDIIGIFNKDLLDDRSLKETFDKLIGIIPEKPFECVGSRGEVNAALHETLQQYKDKKQPLPYLLEYYNKIYKAGEYDINSYLTYFDSNNSIPEPFYDILKSKI